MVVLSYTDGTYQNLKLLNTSQTGTWQGSNGKSCCIWWWSYLLQMLFLLVLVILLGNNLFFDASVIGNGK
jgi:hypothetical protein